MGLPKAPFHDVLASLTREIRASMTGCFLMTGPSSFVQRQASSWYDNRNPVVSFVFWVNKRSKVRENEYC